MILFKDSVPPYKVSISNLETTEKFGVRGSAAAMKHILGLSVGKRKLRNTPRARKRLRRRRRDRAKQLFRRRARFK
jgi:hypothetical protein